MFRCAGVLGVLLRVLQASLAASRNQLSRHHTDHPVTDKATNITDSDKEELRTALVAAQESCALEILLEACLETEEDKVSRTKITLP